MNNQTLLTIIIPCWNVEKFVPNLLNSLIKQGLDEIEIILVNDGSTDKTAEVAKRYSESNKSIKFVNFEKNKGVSVARNAGIENAKGKYIQFFDADDDIPYGTLNFYRKNLSKRDNDIIVCGHEIRYNGKTKTIDNAQYDNAEFNTSDFLKLFFIRKIRCHICSQIYLRSFLIDNSLRFPENMKIGEDCIFYRSAFFHAQNIYCCSQLIFIYCIRLEAAMGGYKIYNKRDIEFFFRDVELIENLSKNLSKIQNYANFFLAERYLGNLIKFIRFAKADKKEIANALIEKKYLLSNKTCFRIPQTIVFWIFRFIPIKTVLKIYTKGEVDV